MTTSTELLGSLCGRWPDDGIFYDLILFTDSFPFGNAEPFLETEIIFLAQQFEHILLIPFSARGTITRSLPKNVHFTDPLWPEKWSFRKKVWHGVLNRASLSIHLREFFQFRVYARKKNFSAWLYSLIVTRHLCCQPNLMKVIRANAQAVFYFYWGMNSSWLIPFLRERFPLAKIVTRFHRIDLYSYLAENADYMPMQSELLRYASRSVFISRDGLNYARKKFGAAFRGDVFPLGVFDHGMTPGSADGVFKIVSCSRMVPVKRLNIIIEALALIDFPVEWTHLGDGPLRRKLTETVFNLPPYIRVNFLGQKNNQEVVQYYATHPIDLFINVSSSEGIPVSIMEALAAGIPVLATSVGGTPELVDSRVGGLLPSSINGQQLSQQIISFKKRLLEEGESLRQMARVRWAEKACAEVVYENFTTFLKNL